MCKHACLLYLQVTSLETSLNKYKNALKLTKEKIQQLQAEKVGGEGANYGSI